MSDDEAEAEEEKEEDEDTPKVCLLSALMVPGIWDVHSAIACIRFMYISATLAKCTNSRISCCIQIMCHQSFILLRILTFILFQPNQCSGGL